MSTTPYLPGHPQPTPEQLQREEQLRNAFLVLGKTLQPILEGLPRGTKVLTIEKKIQGFHYRLTLSPIAEEK
ncbi:MAG TPA: hypothetical protein VKP58_08230 [Candidatus Acidoferrum sp.]|nr:hypothetical protein [Candidatus Acidoferrum sp.]